MNLRNLLAKILDVPSKSLNNDSAPENISSWDSFNGLLIASELEKATGVKFTAERAFNKTLRSPLLFARVGTNDAPGGKFPLFWFEKGELKLKEPMKEKRELNKLL